MEATAGFEPANRGFADLRLGPLGYVASGVAQRARPGSVLAAPRGFEPRSSDPKSAVLPLDEGAGIPRISRDRAKKWSGRRDSNPRPSPWQGDALPTEPLPLEDRYAVGAESQIRTGDTAIFSRVLYRLSYLGPMVALRGCRRRSAGYHAVSAGRHRAGGSRGATFPSPSPSGKPTRRRPAAPPR